MKAIIYEGPKKVTVKDVPEPEVKPGEVLVKISYAGICGTDLNIYAGTHPRAKAPLIPGHEFSGVTMTDCSRFPKGTRVAPGTLYCLADIVIHARRVMNMYAIHLDCWA